MHASADRRRSGLLLQFACLYPLCNLSLHAPFVSVVDELRGQGSSRVESATLSGCQPAWLVAPGWRL